MKKNKIGLFLKELRHINHLTQEELVNIFDENYICISQKSISNWENGKKLPTLECLLVLSEIYKVTIDELLNGESEQLNNYDELYNINIISPFFSNDNDIIIKDEECDLIIKVLNRLDELINIRICRDLNYKEYTEFVYILNNFTYNVNQSFNKNDKYILDYMDEFLKSNTNLTIEEKKFELYKCVGLKINWMSELNYFKENGKINYEIYFKLFDKFYFIQKDIILMKLIDLLDQDLKNDIDLKKLINMCIKSGAYVNELFNKSNFKIKVKCRIIDTVERLYNYYCKPLLVLNTNTNETFLVENNYYNHILLTFGDFFSFNFNCDCLEFYNCMKENNLLSDELYLNYAKNNNLNLNEPLDIIKHKVNIDMDYDFDRIYDHLLYEDWNNGLNELNCLVDKLKSGEKYHYVMEKNYFLTYELSCYKNFQNNSYKNYLENVNFSLTNDLLLNKCKINNKTSKSKLL